MSSEEDLFSDNPYNEESVYSEGQRASEYKGEDGASTPLPDWLNQYLAYDKMRLLNDVDPLTLNEIRVTMGDQEFIDHWMLSQDEYNYVVDGQSTLGDMNELENIDEVTDDGNTRFSEEEEYINTDGDDMEDNYKPEEEYKSPVIAARAGYIPAQNPQVVNTQGNGAPVMTVNTNNLGKKPKQIPNEPIQIHGQGSVRGSNRVQTSVRGSHQAQVVNAAPQMVQIPKVPQQATQQYQQQHQAYNQQMPPADREYDDEEYSSGDEEDDEDSVEVRTVKPAYSVYHPVGGESYLIGPDGKVEKNKQQGSQYVQKMVPGSVPLKVAEDASPPKATVITRAAQQDQPEEDRVEDIVLPNGLKAKRIHRGRLTQQQLLQEKENLLNKQQKLMAQSTTTIATNHTTHTLKSSQVLNQEKRIEASPGRVDLADIQDKIYVNEAGQKIYINSKGKHMVIEDAPEPVQTRAAQSQQYQFPQSQATKLNMSTAFPQAQQQATNISKVYPQSQSQGVISSNVRNLRKSQRNIQTLPRKNSSSGLVIPGQIQTNVANNVNQQGHFMQQKKALNRSSYRVAGAQQQQVQQVPQVQQKLLNQSQMFRGVVNNNQQQQQIIMNNNNRVVNQRAQVMINQNAQQKQQQILLNNKGQQIIINNQGQQILLNNQVQPQQQQQRFNVVNNQQKQQQLIINNGKQQQFIINNAAQQKQQQLLLNKNSQIFGNVVNLNTNRAGVQIVNNQTANMGFASPQNHHRGAGINMNLRQRALSPSPGGNLRNIGGNQMQILRSPGTGVVNRGQNVGVMNVGGLRKSGHIIQQQQQINRGVPQVFNKQARGSYFNPRQGQNVMAVGGNTGQSIAFI